MRPTSLCLSISFSQFHKKRIHLSLAITSNGFSNARNSASRVLGIVHRRMVFRPTPRNILQHISLIFMDVSAATSICVVLGKHFSFLLGIKITIHRVTAKTFGVRECKFLKHHRKWPMWCLMAF